MFACKLQLLSLSCLSPLPSNLSPRPIQIGERASAVIDARALMNDLIIFLQINGITAFSTRELAEGDVVDLSGTKPYSFFKQLKIELLNNKQQGPIDNQSEVIVYCDKKEEKQVAVLQSNSAYYALQYIVTYEESASIPGIEHRDGMVFFKDAESFSQTLSNLNNLDSEELEFWEDSLDFDNSLRREYSTSFDTLEDIDLESSSKLYIPDDSLATVVNQDGIFVVGTEIHKITNDYEYIIKDLDFGKLSQIGDAEAKLPDNVSRFDISKGIGDNLSPQVRFVGKSTRKKAPYADIGVTHLSAHLIAWNRSYFFYSSVGVRIKGRKLKRRRWRNDKMWFASLDYSARVRTRVPGITSDYVLYYGNRVGRHRKRVGRVINFLVWPIGVRHDVDFIDCRFEYNDDGYPRRIWQERWD